MRLVDLLLMLFFLFLRVSSELLIFFVRGNVGKSEMLFFLFEDMFFSFSSALLLLFLVEFWVFVSRVKTTLIPPSYELSK